MGSLWGQEEKMQKESANDGWALEGRAESGIPYCGFYHAQRFCFRYEHPDLPALDSDAVGN
ncbi:hypothetical protein GCM10027396_13370 [Insolitispirillum peregrinum]